MQIGLSYHQGAAVNVIQDIRMGPNHRQGSSLVIFMHAYGSNAGDMARHVGEQLAPLAPSTVLRFPDAPRPVSWGGHGRSWFDIEDIRDQKADGNVMAPRAMGETWPVNQYIDRVMAEEAIPPERVIVAGFSQGATMAYFSSLMRTRPVAGVFSISGGALDQLAAPRVKPPVMLLAGEKENSLYSGREQAEKTHGLLKERGFRTAIYLTPDNGHDIDRKSIEVLAWFIDRMVPRPVPEMAYALAM